MRLWLSLATVLALSLYVIGVDPKRLWDAKQRYYYEPCPDEKVCIYFDDDSCLPEAGFTGFVTEKLVCGENIYGRNYAGLEILPIPPSLWKVTMTVKYCIDGCWDDANAGYTMGMIRLQVVKFKFGQFFVSFHNDDRYVRVTWTDNNKTESQMHWKGNFFSRPKWQYYNIYEFEIESKQGKLIDLARGDIEYEGYVLDETEIIYRGSKKKTPLLEPLRFHDRLQMLNVCDMDKYFDQTNCPKNSACVEVQNAPIYKTCALGKLQFFSDGIWTDVFKLKCENMKWSYTNEKLSTNYQSIMKLDHARCVVSHCELPGAATCSLAVPTALSEDICPSECKAAELKHEHNINCPTGFDLEVELRGWRYHNDVMCYGDYLSRIDSDGKFMDIVKAVRCRKQRKCNLSKFVDCSKCALDEHCLTPSNIKYSCDDGYQLQYTSIAEPTAWNALDKLECIEDQLRLTIKTELSDLVPLNVRCMKKKKCDLKLFAQPVGDCGADNICVEPSLESNKKVICPAEFGLQVQSLLNEWETATITCIRNEVLFVDRTTTVPLQIRCIHKNISKFFDANDCKDEEICKEPKNCESMKCEVGDHNPPWNLQRKSSKTNVWSDVHSANCNSGIFVIDNIPETADSSSKFRCVLKKCTSCKNPCPNCVSDSSFTKSNKWDECVKFSCGQNTRTIFGTTEPPLNSHFECSNFDNGASFWKVNGSSEAKNLQIQCEKLCWLQNPLKSTCPPNSESCKEHDSVDFTKLSCGIFMYADIRNDERLHIKQLECDKHDGLWKAKNVDGNKEVIIPEGSNVYCYEGKCELSRIFPSCESDDNECTDYDIDDHRYTCKEPYTFWERYRSDGEWKEMKGVSELQCLAGSIVANEKRKEYDFQANCRIKVPQKEAARSQLGVYLGIMVLVLLLTVILIANVILRIAGKGWLHTLVIEMIRNRNKKRARSHSSSSSLSKSKNARTPIAISPMTNSSSKKTQKGSPSSKSNSSSKKMRKMTGRPTSTLSSVPASSDGTSKMNSEANEPKKIFVI